MYCLATDSPDGSLAQDSRGKGPFVHIMLIPNLLPSLLSEPCLPAPLPLPVGPREAKPHLMGKRTALV